MTALDLRPSPISGKWYEGNPRSLAKQVDALLENARAPKNLGVPIAVIAPHAGHQYSGAVAAHAFAALQGLSPDLVVILSPFHNFALYPLITTKHQAYSTPLGDIEVDRSALDELQAALDIPITPILRDTEHSLEIELPFLQRVFQNGFKLLPLMLRAHDPDTLRNLGRALAGILKNKNATLVASTDLSHFYDQKTAESFDSEMLKRIQALDPEAVLEAERTGKGFACGHAAVAATLWASLELGANKAKTLCYATSGDVTSDYSSVVGYGAVAILKQ